MNVNRDPFSEMAAVRDRLNRAIEDAGGEGRQQAGMSRVWRPLADILEDHDAWTIQLDLPGVRRESIDIQLTAENLVVRGERRPDRPQGTHLLRCERPEGAFLFILPIAAPINHERVDARYRDGVLSVRLAKAETLKPRKIRISGDEGASQEAEVSPPIETEGTTTARRGKKI